LFAGQTVEVNGVIGPPKPPVAEGLFDYPAYLRNLGVYRTLRVGDPAEWKIISSPRAPPLADRFTAWARKALARGLPTEDETLHLEWALTLGWKTGLTEEASEPFMRAATYHIFAVDGLRVMIIAAILIGLLRVVGLPRAVCGLIAIPMIAFYAAMTGWPASAMRAMVMIVVVFVGWAMKRPSDLVNSLFVAAFIILIWDPRELFRAGFQLSFVVVLCMLLIRPSVDALVKRLFRPDPLLPDALRPRWQIMLRTPGHWLLDLFITSLVAWLGSIPLAALYFHLLTPVSGLANVAAVPLCSLVLISNLSSLLLAAWFPFASELFNHAGWFCMRCIQVVSQRSAHWPAAYWYVASPGWFAIALYYLALLTLLTGWLWRGNRRGWKFATLGLLAGIWLGLRLADFRVTRVSILPLEGGHSVFVDSHRAGGSWLLDCGNESSVNAIVKPFLRAHGVNRLNHMVLTHGEAAYTGGAKVIQDEFRPQHVYWSAAESKSPSYMAYQSARRSGEGAVRTLEAGDCLGVWTVLNPAATDRGAAGGDNVLVFRLELDGTRVLLLSDLGRAGQRALLARTNDLRAEIVVAGFPAAGEPLSDLLLEAVQPRTMVVADNKRPTLVSGVALRDRLSGFHVPVLYECDCRAVTLSLQSGSWVARSMEDESD
jgi:competence protein ComEC